MIPSSLNSLLLLISIPFLTISMEMPRTSSGVVHKKPQGSIPASSSMVFPVPKQKKEKSESQDRKNGSVRGSLIQMGRTASEFFIGRRSSSGEVASEKKEAPNPPPAISAPLTTAVLKAAITPIVTQKKELIFGQPIYIINQQYTTYDKNGTAIQKTETIVVSLEGQCDAAFQVSCLKDFKKCNGHLKREDVLIFIDKVLEKSCNKTLHVGSGMSYKEREQATGLAIKYIKENKNKPEFNAPFYLARKSDNSRICVFESELSKLEEIKK